MSRTLRPPCTKHGGNGGAGNILGLLPAGRHTVSTDQASINSFLQLLVESRCPLQVSFRHDLLLNPVGAILLVLGVVPPLEQVGDGKSYGILMVMTLAW